MSQSRFYHAQPSISQTEQNFATVSEPSSASTMFASDPSNRMFDDHMPEDAPPSYDELYSPLTAQSTATSQSNTVRQRVPIAIPAKSVKHGAPFIRAYPPSLETYQISQHVFMDFLDELNKLGAASPPTKVLGLTGTAVAMVPISGADGATSVGASTVGQSQCEIFIERSNRAIFGPHGLRADIARIDAVAKISNMPIFDAEGNIDKRAQLVSPNGDLETPTSTSAQQRWLNALTPYIAPLDLDPPADSPSSDTTSGISSLTATAGRHREAVGRTVIGNRPRLLLGHCERTNKVQEGLEKQLQKLELKVTKALEGEGDRKSLRELHKIRREKAQAHRIHDREMRKVTRDIRRDNVKDERAVKKVLWLLIREWDDVVELEADAAFRPELDGFGTQVTHDAVRPAELDSNPVAFAELDSTSVHRFELSGESAVRR